MGRRRAFLKFYGRMSEKESLARADSVPESVHSKKQMRSFGKLAKPTLTQAAFRYDGNDDAKGALHGDPRPLVAEESRPTGRLSLVREEESPSGGICFL